METNENTTVQKPTTVVELLGEAAAELEMQLDCLRFEGLDNEPDYKAILSELWEVEAALSFVESLEQAA